VIHALNFAGFQRDDFGLRSGFIERLARFCHFHLFKAIRYKDSYFLSIEFPCHTISLPLMLIDWAAKNRPY
jgi:hypothetical protein